MLTLSAEERALTGALPPEGVSLQGVALRLHTCMAEEGMLCIVDTQGEIWPIWLDHASWRGWYEQLLGTADLNVIDTQLAADIALWAISPLLDLMQITPTEPVVLRPCTRIPQLAVLAEWQVEQHRLQGMLFHWPVALINKIVNENMAVVREPRGGSVRLALYAGWCRLSVEQLQQIQPDMAIRLACIGPLYEGVFALLLPQGRIAKVRLVPEDTMQLDELIEDIETLLEVEEEQEQRDEERGAATFCLDSLPQTLWVEVGKVEVDLGALRTWREGDLLPVVGGFSPTVTLRLNGRAVGRGELIACGDTFLVRITRWYFTAPDQVNA